MIKKIRGDDQIKGTIFKIQRYCVQDGPGIRSTVFLMGCLLKCKWCSNPESQSNSPVLMFVRALCNLCGLCIERCPIGAISIDGDAIRIDRDSCSVCGECVKYCYPKALEIVGKEMALVQVIEEAQKDRHFYQNSGGGVTLSGGEPLNQPNFLNLFLERCNEAGIHTCIDTCGFATHEITEELLQYTDLFLYDLKLMNTVMHQRYTGVPNERILNNAKLIANSGIPLIIRIPLIPGINDSEENIRSTASFVRSSLKVVKQIDLLPYHRFGMSKYDMLGRPYCLAGIQTPSKEDIEKARHIIVDEFNFECQIGG